MPKFSRKLFVAGGLVATLALGGIAYAYFTNSGGGTGSASVGSSDPVTLVGTTTDALYPAGPGVDVTIEVTNPGNGAQYVQSVSLDGVTVDAGHSTCDVSAFSMADVDVLQTLDAGASTEVHGSLQMADNGSSQDDCQGASLTLNLSSI
jgi:hypothetical protein